MYSRQSDVEGFRSTCPPLPPRKSDDIVAHSWLSYLGCQATNTRQSKTRSYHGNQLLNPDLLGRGRSKRGDGWGEGKGGSIQRIQVYHTLPTLFRRRIERCCYDLSFLVWFYIFWGRGGGKAGGGGRKGRGSVWGGGAEVKIGRGREWRPLADKCTPNQNKCSVAKLFATSDVLHVDTLLGKESRGRFEVARRAYISHCFPTSR